jgi:hypothetical protein
LLSLNEDGILYSLDFTKIASKSNGKSRLYNILFSDFNYTATLILIANMITMIIYIRIFRNRRMLSEATQRRTTEINQVIQDIIRLNNIQMAIGGNLANLQATNILSQNANVNGQNNNAQINTNNINQPSEHNNPAPQNSTNIHPPIEISQDTNTINTNNTTVQTNNTTLINEPGDPNLNSDSH